MVGQNFLRNPSFIHVSTPLHKGAKCHHDQIILHSVSAHRKPFLLYVNEYLNLSIRKVRSLDHAWCCAMLLIFHLPYFLM